MLCEWFKNSDNECTFEIELILGIGTQWTRALFGLDIIFGATQQENYTFKSLFIT